MKKLYDEIMALQIHDHTSFTNYQLGFNDSLDKAAELAKRYDDEIERLKIENKFFIKAIKQIEDKVSVIDKLMN